MGEQTETTKEAGWRGECHAYATGNPTHGGHQGVTIREYFAGQAMMGILSADLDGAMGEETIARLAVDQADALIARLEKSNDRD